MIFSILGVPPRNLLSRSTQGLFPKQTPLLQGPMGGYPLFPYPEKKVYHRRDAGSGAPLCPLGECLRQGAKGFSGLRTRSWGTFFFRIGKIVFFQGVPPFWSIFHDLERFLLIFRDFGSARASWPVRGHNISPVHNHDPQLL